ncbi:hypothetical protein ACGF3K_14515 [Streptomyces sp. NPDC047980]|uniref:hypothetical protein n=1 Tax=Streptomyces sp. NPDC047980 TaxID=3365494 RepID=UPI003712DE06
MPLPAGLSTVTVSGSFKRPDGTAMKGKLLFTPEPAILTSGVHGTLLLGTTEVTLDANGAFSVALLATDDADVTPTGWTYRVQERWHDSPGRSYALSLPAAAPAVDLADVAPTAPAVGEYVVVTGPAGPQGPAGSEAEAEAYTDTAITTHAAAADPHGDRAWADNKFATSTALGTLNTAVTDLDGFVQDCLTRVAAIEQGTAFLAGLNVAGNAQVSGGNLTVTDFTKGYRFRVDGSALDLEATGTDLIVSNWSGSGFNGTQRPYLRLSADAQNVQIAGKVEYVDALYGATRHVLNGAANQAGFFGATPVGRQTVTGSRGDGSALASLLDALEALGFITDNTTA